jgi:ribosomal protein S17E
MKKQSHLITTLIPEIISRFKKTLYKDYDSYLSYVGELGGINSKWIINELSLIKQKLGRNFGMNKDLQH